MQDASIIDLLTQGALSFAFFGMWIVPQTVLAGRLDGRRERLLRIGVLAMTGIVTLVVGQRVAEGVLLDQRGVVIALATAYTGILGGALTATVCAAVRWDLGGAGALAGVVGILADLLVAWAITARGWNGLREKPPLLRLSVLGMAVGITEALSLVVVSGGDGLRFLTVFGDELFVTQLVGTLLLGSLIELADERKALVEALSARVDTLDQVLKQTVDAFSKAMVHSDPYTAGHETRVADLCKALGRRMGLDDDRLEGLEVAADAHDVGQIKIPAEILLRPRKLTALEFAFVRQHPEVGRDILRTIDFRWPVADIVYQHHENYDGTGYPQGLRGEQILLEARILRVADTLESLCSHRPFRAALAMEDALAQLRDLRGTALDPRVVDACIALVEEQDYRFPPMSGSPSPPNA